MDNLHDSIRSEIAKLGDPSQLNEHYRQLMQHTYNDPDVKAFLRQHQVSKDELNHSTSKLYEFVNEKDKIAKGQPGLVPGYTPTLVWNNHLIDISYQPTKETLAKQKARSTRKRLHTFSMPKMIHDCSLNDIDVDGTNRLQLLRLAIKFVDDESQNYKQHQHHFYPGIYLYGNFGVGKTYFLAAIANELVNRGVPTTMVHFPSFVVEMKNSINDHTNEDKLDLIKKPPVLFLDDVGADSLSTWIRDDVFGVILEYRMQNELPTFFSSNYSMDELEKDHLSIDNHGNHDEVKAQRLMQRVRFLSREYKLDGEDRRPK